MSSTIRATKIPVALYRAVGPAGKAGSRLRRASEVSLTTPGLDLATRLRVFQRALRSQVERRDALLDIVRAVNTTLEPEKQIAFSRLTGYPPTNIQAMKNLPPDLKKLALTDEQVASFGKIQRGFDYMAMFAYRDQIRDRWNKEVLGS